MSVLSGAVETAPVSDLHARGSVDPDDFAVPGGREEEWRFTPLRRLRGLEKDAPFTGAVRVEVEAAPELVVETEDLTERKRLTASGGFLPTDRVSARAYAATERATVLTVPKDTTASAPTYVRVTGTGASAASSGHPARISPPAATFSFRGASPAAPRLAKASPPITPANPVGHDSACPATCLFGHLRHKRRAEAHPTDR